MCAHDFSQHGCTFPLSFFGRISHRAVNSIITLWLIKIRVCFYSTLGLIIDAFGELRDQQEQVKEDMEVSLPTSDSTLLLLLLLLWAFIFPTVFIIKNHGCGRK